MSDDEQSESDLPHRPVRITKDRILSSARFLERHERIFNVLSTTVTALFTVILATSTVFGKRLKI